MGGVGIYPIWRFKPARLVDTRRVSNGGFMPDAQSGGNTPSPCKLYGGAREIRQADLILERPPRYLSNHGGYFVAPRWSKFALLVDTVRFVNGGIPPRRKVCGGTQTGRNPDPPTPPAPPVLIIRWVREIRHAGLIFMLFAISPTSPR